MDNEEKYKKLIRAIKGLRDMKPHDECLENWIKENAPEIAEPEDEKVRKAMIKMVHDSIPTEFERYNTTKVDCLVWLRKQGEQKPVWSEEDEEILKEIISDVKFEGYNNDMLANSYRKIRWLKSLEQRIKL